MSAVVAGHICLDMIPGLGHVSPEQLKSLFQPGHLLDVGPATLSTGGPVSNTGLALHRLGIPTRLVAKIGADPFGEVVKQIVAGFDPALLEGIRVEPGVSTSYSIIISPPGVDRTFLHNPGANDSFTAADIPFDLVRKADLFHFGYPPAMRQMYLNGGRELAEIMRRAKSTGATTSLDMSFPDPVSEAGRADWRSILSAALPWTDLFLPSLEEILFMLHREMYERLNQAASVGDRQAIVSPGLVSGLGDELLALGVRVLALKLGELGLYLRTADRERIAGLGRACPSDIDGWSRRELWAPCFQVDVVGTTGSGDATIAGLLSALLRDDSPEAAITAGVAVGACNVEAADALGGIRTWEATQQRIAGGWPRRSLSLTSPGWRLDPGQQLWTGPKDKGA